MAGAVGMVQSQAIPPRRNLSLAGLTSSNYWIVALPPLPVIPGK